MNSLEKFLADELTSRTNSGIIRNLKIASPALKDFTSNDYLGLAKSKDLQQKIKQSVGESTILNGATGSRLLSGNTIHHEQLEAQLAETFQAEACLIFNSGYSANLGVLSSIPTRHDTILYDELCHASIKDGIRLSLAKKHSFKHNNLTDLQQKISIAKGKVFIVVESIYSMDGDYCPLEQVVALAEASGCYIILDEAHSTGVLGPGGAGLAFALNLHSKIAIRIYTFGKAIGAHGACVAGSKNLVNYLINFSRSFIYTTALPQHTIISIAESFRFIQQHSSMQNLLQHKISVFTKTLQQHSHSTSAIQTIIYGSVAKTKSAAERLLSKGFDVRPILSPTVPEGKERLRLCLHTFNEDEDIVTLAKEFNNE